LTSFVVTFFGKKTLGQGVQKRLRRKQEGD
jgi:hypothetical protein